MSNFENDPRRIQELRGRPIADLIYKSVFGDCVVNRTELKDNYLLDKEFAIDNVIVSNCGLILTGQEKYLSSVYAKYNSLTIEFMQNPITDERGDWYKMAVQFYFTAYFNQDNSDFCKWILVNWSSLAIKTMAEQVSWNLNCNKDGRARASFKWINFDRIPTDCIIARSGE
jgi:hypothetical protein